MQNRIYNNKNFKFAFTLTETLITLVIIGVVAALTIPMIIKQYQWHQYQAALKKAIGLLNQGIIKYHVDNGEPIACAYWKKKPNSFCSAQCKSYNANGSCAGYACPDGSALPANYNGFFTDCVAMHNYFIKRFNITKYCAKNAYSNGCIPKYEGLDTIYKAKNPDASEYDINKATSGSSGWNQSRILEGPAFVTSDGMIFFSGGYVGMGDLGIDVNGKKGPNKWGYDVRKIYPQIARVGDDPQYIKDATTLEKGGVSTLNLLYKDVSKY